MTTFASAIYLLPYMAMAGVLVFLADMDCPIAPAGVEASRRPMRNRVAGIESAKDQHFAISLLAAGAPCVYFFMLASKSWPAMR